MTKKERVICLLPLPAIVALADIAITLYRQPVGYWEGRYSVAFDFNPIVEIVLRHSPWWALPGAVGWLIAIAAGFWVLPRLLSRWLFVFLTLTHFVCVAGWLIRWDLGFLAVIVPFGAIVFWTGMRSLARIDGEKKADSS